MKMDVFGVPGEFRFEFHYASDIWRKKAPSPRPTKIES